MPKTLPDMVCSTVNDSTAKPQPSGNRTSQQNHKRNRRNLLPRRKSFWRIGKMRDVAFWQCPLKCFYPCIGDRGTPQV